MEDIRKSISTLKELERCTDLDEVRKLKREFEDLNLEQDMGKCDMLSLDQLIEHTKDLVNEVEGLSTYGKFLKRIDLDVCKDTRCDILSTSKLLDIENKRVRGPLCTLCISPGENDLYLLPKDIQVLIMENIHHFTSLCTVASLKYTTDLCCCQISSCEGVRELVTSSSSSSFALQSLQTLQLHNLVNLEALIGGKKASCNVFPCLQELVIFNCRRIKVLFTVGLLSNLKNLEKLEVTGCWKLEEIIGESLDNDKDLNEAMKCVTLPKLRYLNLFDLQNLKSVCPPTRRLICKSLKEIHIKNCPELEQCVYAAFEDSGESSPSPFLYPIDLELYSNRTEGKTLEQLQEDWMASQKAKKHQF